MRKVLMFGLLILFTSCALTRQQRQDNRVVKKLEKIKEKFPDSYRNATTELVRIDTVLVEIRIAGETQLDTVKVTEYLTEFLHDTVSVTEFIDRFIEIAKDSIQVDTLGIHLKIVGVALAFQLTKDEQHIIVEKPVETITIDKTRVVNKIPWWIWLIIGTMGVLMVVMVIKR